MDIHPTTVTIPEAAYEVLIDLYTAAGRVIGAESARRKTATLDLYDEHHKAEADLYDRLTALQGEYEYATRATASLHYDDIVDAEVADA